MKLFKSTVRILDYSGRKLIIEIPEHDDSVCAYFLHNLKNVSEFDLQLKPPFKRRSTGYKSQNHHFNGHCMQLAEFTGYSFDEFKGWIKREAMSAGYPAKYDLRGNLMPISESEASIEDCAILIEECHKIAAEFNYILKEK